MRLKVAIFMLAGIVGSGLAPATVQASETGIEVRVVSSETRRALVGVSVAITARDGETTRATTDNDGVARIVALDPGLYTLDATAAGFVEALEPSIRVVARSTTPVRLEMLPVEDGFDEVVVVARAVQADLDGATAKNSAALSERAATSCVHWTDCRA
jgi:hypothetical protein